MVEYSANDSSSIFPDVDFEAFGEAVSVDSSDIVGWSGNFLAAIERRVFLRLPALAFEISDLLSSTILSLASSGDKGLDSVEVSDVRRVRRAGVLVSNSLANDEALVDRLGVRVASGVAMFDIEACFLDFARGVSGDLSSGAADDALVIRLDGVSSSCSAADIRRVLIVLRGVETSALFVDNLLVLLTGVLTSLPEGFDGSLEISWTVGDASAFCFVSTLFTFLISSRLKVS